MDETHDPMRASWVRSARNHPEFPIQNLPLGVFSPPVGSPRAGVAIGDMILDLRACLDAGLLSDGFAQAVGGATLNPLLALPPDARRALRHQLSSLLDAEGDGRAEELQERILFLADDCTLHLPCAIGDYTDFYAGIHHATNTGRLFRPDNPLLPNYKHMPIAYHGRASSVRPSGGEILRPNGQRKPPDQALPDFGPCRNLDFELELGVWIGPGNALGAMIPMSEAARHVAGFCLLNDWSARDVQAWEYQPLGPFLAKSFSTTISPWIVTAEALAPFREAQPTRPVGNPQPLRHLHDPMDQAEGALDISLEALILTQTMRERSLPPYRLTSTNARELYWTVAQMVAHHASGGCNLRPGDLFGTGTISSTAPSGFGSLLEITQNGRQPLSLPSGDVRRFLEDGDEIILRAHCRRDGWVTIGFGECRGRVAAARA